MASNHHRLLLLAAALLLLLPSTATAVEYCKKGRDYPVKVSGVEVVPDPVVRGEPATFKISASTDKNSTKGKLVIDVTYFIFQVHSETHNLCDETYCPATGEFVLASEQTSPRQQHNYTATFGFLHYHHEAVGDGNEELTCISFGISIGFVTPVAIRVSYVSERNSGIRYFAPLRNFQSSRKFTEILVKF